MNSRKKIILASASPRRKELLAQLGLQFEIRVSGTDESSTETQPEKLVEELSSCKAEAVWKLLSAEEKKESILIGADTVVAVDGKILGKPADKEDAENMLTLLQGRWHQVYTGVTLISEENTEHFYEKTDVKMYPMSREEILSYIATGEPMDKAGAYGIQGKCAAYIEGISGDYYNVVGLPIGRLYQKLKAF